MLGSTSDTKTAPRPSPTAVPGASHFKSGIDQVRDGKAHTAKASEAETIGAIMKVAATGSTANASSGTPRIAKPLTERAAAQADEEYRGHANQIE